MSRIQPRLQPHLRQRLLGLAATLALVAFVVGVPLLLLAINAIPSPANFGWSTLTAPDDGTVALAVIGVVAWIAWAVFTVSVVLDLAARARGRRTLRIPGLAVPQHTAGQLVGVAAMLFLSLPAVAAVATAPRAEAVPAQAPLPPTTVDVAALAPLATAPAPHLTSASTPHERTEPYTVKRGDSLWKIAEERLGDGTRYVELVARNRDVLHGEPDFLLPGTVLRIPAADPDDEPTRDDTAYVVKSGDTLSQIAEDELGNATAYPKIFDASQSTMQSDGEHLTDPDLIRPGWRLTIPEATPAPPERPKHRHEEQPAVPVPPANSSKPTPQKTSPTASGSQSVDTTEVEDGLPSWVLPGLAGGGAALAGSLLLVLRQHRRTQLRYRRPGQVIAPPPPELRPAEKTIHASGALMAPRIEDFNEALRHLGPTAPRVVTATLDADTVTVTVQLAEPATLPSPWTGEATNWTIRLNDATASPSEAIAPYPLMVSIGAGRDGALVYVNLEELRTVTLTGDSDRAMGLGRHIAAELSLNPWSTLVEIDTLGMGSELADIDPVRLHHHADADTGFLDQMADDLEDEDPQVEPDQYRALITTTTASDEEAMRKVAKIITSYAGRPGAAIITIAGEPRGRDVEFRLTTGGRLTVRQPVVGLALDLVAAGLTAEEAHACATLVDITRDANNFPAPESEDADSCADKTGALTSDLTLPRESDGPVGDTSLLPLAATSYEESAAVMADDVAVLAPLAAADAAARVAEQDPDLDEDLARWQASTLVGPKLTLLGPVSARTLGDPRKMAHRRPYYVELLAFLVLHPRGVTADDVADAFGIRTDRARKDLGVLRGWLGRDPRTGKPHLPNARQTHADGVHAKYAVHGVATDMDLFRRLRTRGQSRGAAGIDDLRLALTLVSGEPFTDLRATGWSWLLDNERHDHLMSCAIVDSAHIVTTHALAGGDLDLARFSAETAYRAAPYDETSRLDLIAVDKALGQDEEAERLLAEGVLNRSDDDLGPIKIPDHTEQIIRQHGWIAERQTRSAG
jgi:LysM repeat protein